MESKNNLIKDNTTKANKKAIHKNTKCSKCGQSPIEGIRYICLECPDFNLCSSCEKNCGEKHGHNLLKLRRPEDLEKYKFYFKNLKEDEYQHIIDLNKCQFKCINLKNLYITLNNNNFIPIELIIKNIGDEEWPTPCYFVCDEDSEIKGEKVKLSKCKGKPGEEYVLKIKINLNNLKKTGIYKSFWILKNEKGDAFGEKVEINVKDIFEKEEVKKEDEKKDYRDELDKNVKEIKQKYDILFSYARIRNALIRTKGNKENAIKILQTEKNLNSYYLK